MLKINFLATTNRLQVHTPQKMTYIMVKISLLHQKFNIEITSSNKVKLKLSHSLWNIQFKCQR